MNATHNARPPVFQSLWIGASLGPLQKVSIASFLRFGAEYHLYSYGHIVGLPRGVVRRDASEILPESDVFCYRRGPGAGSVAAFSNLFRYKLLLDRGGWWVDTDVVCLRPFSFSEEIVFAGERSRLSSKVATGVMKLPAGHDVARRCYEGANRADKNSLRWGQIGPDLLTRIVAETRRKHQVREPVVFCPVPWWRWASFMSPDPRRCVASISEKSYSVHLWHDMWRRVGKHENTTFPGSSYIGMLLARYEAFIP